MIHVFVRAGLLNAEALPGGYLVTNVDWLDVGEEE